MRCPALACTSPFAPPSRIVRTYQCMPVLRNSPCTPDRSHHARDEKNRKRRSPNIRSQAAAADQNRACPRCFGLWPWRLRHLRRSCENLLDGLLHLLRLFGVFLELVRNALVHRHGAACGGILAEADIRLLFHALVHLLLQHRQVLRRPSLTTRRCLARIIFPFAAGRAHALGCPWLAAQHAGSVPADLWRGIGAAIRRQLHVREAPRAKVLQEAATRVLRRCNTVGHGEGEESRCEAEDECEHHG
mmetsp:Transcript_47263/g.109362  ORF Transcript_47263/g.109362 Transcript_47263/m.109362 type:complete len:246 (+) Transcript_47263:159-896(+)